MSKLMSAQSSVFKYIYTASIYSKVVKPKPSNVSDLDSISSRSSRNKQGIMIEDPRLEKHVNNDVINKVCQFIYSDDEDLRQKIQDHKND